MAAAILTAASSLLSKSSPLSSYEIVSPSSSSVHLPSTSTSSNTLSGGLSGGAFNVNLWRVIPAKHKTTDNPVSIWVFEKKVLDGIRDLKLRNGVVDVLKKEVSTLSRLRHPHLLHIIEPLEETRTSLTWVSERVSGCLGGVLQNAQASGVGATSTGGGGAGAGGRSGNGRTGKAGRILGETVDTVEMGIDEVEIQKGLSQLSQALSFLHTQARVVHLNVVPDSVLLSGTGDWKLSGLHLNQSLTPTPDGTNKYVYPEIDSRIPPQVQWNLDYLAPEYALDATLSPSNDLYSIGCILYALNVGSGKPPFRNNGSMSSLRKNVDELVGNGGMGAGGWRSGRKWDVAGSEVRECHPPDLLPRLLTRSPQNRITLASHTQHPYFSSLAISTLNFLDPSNFASKPREEKATFLKGLLRVLGGFSERLRKRKVLPALLDEMKDPYLIPFILPLVFEISKSLQKEEFGPVLTKLQPLFGMKDPPQIMMTLLENLPLLEAKTSQPAFRENVMPLIYNSLESDHPPIQEKALEGVPKLCGALDYGTVENVLLVKVAILFTKTRILSVKVKTLECFLHMIPILDKSVLTTKLVPLLAKIKTKEPAVMMATLGVHEAMGARVDSAATATLVLPQLWAMSMGSPLLNVDQFSRFMTVIKTLSARVESEHLEHLRAARQLEDQTFRFSNGNGDGFAAGLGGLAGDNGGEVDFETLVGGGGKRNGTAGMGMGAAMGGKTEDPWDGEGWADSWASDTLPTQTASLSLSSLPALKPTTTSAFSPPPITPTTSASVRSPTSSSSPARLKARPIAASAFNASAFPTPPSTQSRQPTQSFGTTMQPMQPLLPQSQSQARPPPPSSSGPNYNISLAPQTPTFPSYTPALSSFPQAQQQPAMSTMAPMQSQKPTTAPPPGWNPQSQPMLTPTVKRSFDPMAAKSVDWGDFDPLK